MLRAINLSARKSLLGDGLQRQESHNYATAWRPGVFSLCIILLIQPAVTVPVAVVEQPAPSAASLSLAIISSPQLNNGTSSSVLVAERETTVLTPGQMVINAVPEKDRGIFLTYQLAMALREIQVIRSQTDWTHSLEGLLTQYESTFKNVSIYGNFATDLLQWLMEKFHLSPEDVYNQLRSRSKLMCTSDGVCYSPNDVVCFCCPF